MTNLLKDKMLQAVFATCACSLLLFYTVFSIQVVFVGNIIAFVLGAFLFVLLPSAVLTVMSTSLGILLGRLIKRTETRQLTILSCALAVVLCALFVGFSPIEGTD